MATDIREAGRSNDLYGAIEGMLRRKKTEPQVKQILTRIFAALRCDAEPEYRTPAGPADFYLPARRIAVEVKPAGKADPAATYGGAGAAETQLEQLTRYVRSEEERESRSGDVSTRNVPWVGLLTDGRQWWRYEYPGDGARPALMDAAGPIRFYPGQAVELVGWLESAIGRSAGKPWVPPHPYDIFAPFEQRLREIHERHWASRGSVRRGVETKSGIWYDMLRASGMAPRSAPHKHRLFVQHTVLVSVARAVVGTIAGGAVEQDPDYALRDGFVAWPQGTNDGRNWQREIFETASRYDWRSRAGDVLRTLYEDVIPAEDRKAYGEYYTPDWLAEMLTDKILDDRWASDSASRALAPGDELSGCGVLDPACGSGTFLYHAARKILRAQPLQSRELTDTQKADVAAALVHGIDVHPVAVEIARATLLRALPAAPSGGTAALRVYQGDSLVVRRGRNPLLEEGEGKFAVFAKSGQFVLPGAFVRQENFSQNIRRLVESASQRSDLPRDLANRRTPEESLLIEEAHRSLRDICRREGNSVWAWLVINIVAPTLLAERKVDRIVANPPWVVMNDVQVEDRKSEFQSLARDLGVWAGGKGAARADIAAVFIARCSDLYLGEGGRAAWLANRASITSDSWKGFRDKCGSRMCEVLDFSEIREPPFTGAELCAWIEDKSRAASGFARRIARTSDNSRIPRGAHWSDVSGKIEWADPPPRISRGPSGYLDRQGKPLFRAGCNLFPQNLVCVEKFWRRGDGVVSFVTRGARHKPRKNAGVLEGVVPDEQIMEGILPDDLLPFALREPVTACVLPIRNGDLSEEALLSEGYWRKASALYDDNRGARAPKTLVGHLNYQGNMVRQLPLSRGDRSAVIYNGSGKVLRAARSDGSYLVEHKCWYRRCADPAEAAYIVACLNADALRTAFSQARRNDRDFDAHFWKDVPIPLFDRGDPAHRRLAELCGKAEGAAKRVRDAAGASASGSQVKVSRAIRERLRAEGIAGEIDACVRAVAPALFSAANTPAHQ